MSASRLARALVLAALASSSRAAAEEDGRFGDAHTASLPLSQAASASDGAVSAALEYDVLASVDNAPLAALSLEVAVAGFSVRLSHYAVASVSELERPSLGLSLALKLGPFDARLSQVDLSSVSASLVIVGP